MNHINIVHMGIIWRRCKPENESFVKSPCNESYLLLSLILYICFEIVIRSAVQELYVREEGRVLTKIDPDLTFDNLWTSFRPTKQSNEKYIFQKWIKSFEWIYTVYFTRTAICAIKCRDSCPICFEEITENRKWRAFHPCGHWTCCNCYDGLAKNLRPFCRTVISVCLK